MFEISDLRVGYRHLEVLHGVSLEVRDGEVVALLGSNGAGKSSLMSACAGLLKPRAGSIVLDGVDLAGRAPHRVAAAGLSLALGGNRVFHRQSVRTNLELGAYSLSRAARRDSSLYDHVFELFPVLERKEAHAASTLSGGERQMLAIGQALMSRPKVLLLDEPSSGLAPLLVREVFQALHTLRSEGLSLLVAEQTVEQALAIADRGYVLEAGRITIAASADELHANDAVREAYIGSLGEGGGATTR